MNIRATRSEKEQVLPGDRLLPRLDGRITHAITIEAPPRDVWPWLAQMGCRRAGWYSYDWLDNGGEPSSWNIIPELQDLAVGDRLSGNPSDEPDEGFEVIDVEPRRYLLLSTQNHLPGFEPVQDGQQPEHFWRSTWCFFLEPAGRSRTRLIARSNLNFAPKWLVFPLAQIVARPIHFFMQRKQLNGIKMRAEQAGEMAFSGLKHAAC